MDVLEFSFFGPQSPDAASPASRTLTRSTDAIPAAKAKRIRKHRVPKFCKSFETARAQKTFIEGLANNTAEQDVTPNRVWSIFEDTFPVQPSPTVRLVVSSKAKDVDSSPSMEDDAWLGGLFGAPNLLQTVKREMTLAITCAAEAIEQELSIMPFSRPFLGEVRLLLPQIQEAKTKRVLGDIQVRFDEIGDRCCATERSKTWRAQ